MLTVGSLFSGIGGLDLGLERAGMNVIWQSEIDPYGCRVLKKHWPEVVNHGNIKEINWQTIEKPDVICGGYPCQPFSTAGKRRGEEDPRHLWPWVREAIVQLQPRYAILENVRGHLSMGGLSVIGELTAIGYDAEWRVVSAASVGANHRRDRIIIVAYPNNTRPYRTQINTTEAGQYALSGIGRRSADVAYTSSEFCNECGNGNALEQSTNCNICQRWKETDIQETRGRSGNLNVANTNSSDTPNRRQCEVVQSQDSSWRDDGSGSGSNIGQISMGSTGQDSSNVAYPNNTGSGTSPSGSDRNGTQKIQEWKDQPQYGPSGFSTELPHSNSERDGGRFRGFSENQRTVFRGPDNQRGTQEYAGWQWWQIEPNVGRVAHGIPSRVDRLRGLGNAVVPQVAELIGRMVIDYDTNL